MLSLLGLKVTEVAPEIGCGSSVGGWSVAVTTAEVGSGDTGVLVGSRTTVGAVVAVAGGIVEVGAAVAVGSGVSVGVVANGMGSGVSVGLAANVGAVVDSDATVGAGAAVAAGVDVAVAAWVAAGAEVAEELQAAANNTDTTASPAANPALFLGPFK